MRTSPYTALLLATLAACSPAPAENGEPLQRRAHAVKPGDLVITEIFPNPVGTSEDNKEWFEVYNATSEAIDLDGWTFKDNKNQKVLEGTAVVPPKGYAVLGQSADKLANGGVPVDVAYGNAIGLSSDGDELHLLDPDGVEIDAVTYQTAAPWPPKTEGTSLQLDPAQLDTSSNDDGASWCLSTASFGADGALGTPGKANDSCGSGQAGQAGAGGSGQAGAAGSGQAGQAGSGTSGQAGAAGSGQAGAGGATGCQVRFHKIDLNQPDPEGALKDAMEAVELQVQGSFQPGVTTLAGCGVESIAPFDADADPAGVCGPAAADYHALAIGDLTIPASGLVVVGNIGASDRPWLNADGVASSVLKNGPDFLALRGPGGALVTAVSYADNDAPDVHADCAAFAQATQIPADTNTADTPALNQILALCQDGSWQLVPEAAVAWKSPNSCPGGGGAAGSGAGGSGQAGAAGSGQAGQAGSGTSGQGGATAGGAGGAGQAGTAPGGAGQAGAAPGAGAAGAAGTPLDYESAPAQDGDCSCQAPGRRPGSVGALAALALLAGSIRRRRGR